jgi:hypothetical protein
MATLYITELVTLGFDPQGNPVVAPQVPANVEQAVAISGSSLQSVAFRNTTRYVMLNVDSACCLAWGNNPTALTGYHRLAANETRFYTVNAGDKVAVIAST